MRLLPTLLIAVSLLSAAVTAAIAAPFSLIEKGQPRAEIILAEKPARMSRLAAHELQTYLEKISGAKIAIVAQPTGKLARIYVGKSPAADKLALSTEGLANGAYRMASGLDWLALLGPDEDFVPIEPWGRSRQADETKRVNEAFDKISGDTYWNNFRELYSRYYADLDVWAHDDAGTLNAVYDFLRSLGVRWYAPGEIGELVPKQATIALPAVNKTVQPDFKLRRLSYYSEQFGLGELAIWNLRLGLNPGHKLIGLTQPGHGIKFVIMREEMKKAHPEMYAIQKGQPDTTHKGSGAPCLSSELLMKKQLHYARTVFDHFREPMLSIDMVDGYGGLGCEHEACRQQLTPERGWSGSMSDYVWGYQNRVALELHKSHPGRMVNALAYSAYQMPPEKIEMLSPNLAVIECRWRSLLGDEERHQHHKAVREAWLKKLPSKQYFTWDYYLHTRPQQAGRPVFFPHLVQRDLRELKGISLGDSIEVFRHQPGQQEKAGYDPMAIDHLNLYITSRLWWDCEQDLSALLEEYYTRYYGPARAQMKALVEFAEANWMFMGQDGEKIGRSLELLAAAQAAVAPASVEGRRIQMIADFMKPLRALQEQLSRKHDTTLVYRALLTKQAGGQSMTLKKLDGQLPKEFWPDVRVAGLANVLPSKRVKAGAQFQILREGDMLYLGIRCQEPDMAGEKIGSTTPDDPKLLEGDFVSVLFETPSRSFYEIAVNPAGTVLEVDHGEGGSVQWSSGTQTAVHRGDGFWSVEMRIPIAGEGARVLDSLKGIDGAAPKSLFPWYFNVCRQRVRAEGIERSAYAPTGTDNFRLPEKFGKLWGK